MDFCEKREIFNLGALNEKRSYGMILDLESNEKRRKELSIEQYQNFHTLSFGIIPEMFWGNFTQIGLIYISYRFAQSGCIPLKINCLALEGL